MKNKLFQQILLYRVLPIMVLLLQAGIILFWLITSSRLSQIINIVLTVSSVLICLYIMTKREKGAYKLTWIFLILLLPLFGGFIYLLFNFQTSTKRFSEQIEKSSQKAAPLYPLPGVCYENAVQKVPEYSAQISYLQNFSGFPVYGHTETKYLTPGEAAFPVILEELKKAQKYIFLESFIVQKGIMWNTILEILTQKVKDGVLVRVIYDDMGSFFVLPPEYAKHLRTLGIECGVFNPFRPLLTATQNNRDHRKIIVIDGNVAFTGGMNLADEYINAIEKHGYWKDAVVRVEGDAAWSFTLMHLQMWELITGKNEDYATYYAKRPQSEIFVDDGFVLPYADSPMDSEHVGEHVYMQIVNAAKHYVYITTPYLIIDDSMVSALTLAAKSGVDVRIVTPHRWDKWIVHMTTRSYYRELIKAGIQIYEYSSGFIHSKTMVSDDKVATVGTVNLDFRSLYLHFECGVCMYGSEAVWEVKEDVLNILPACKQITLQDCSRNMLVRLFQEFLRVFAPLM